MSLRLRKRPGLTLPVRWLNSYVRMKLLFVNCIQGRRGETSSLGMQLGGSQYLKRTERERKLRMYGQREKEKNQEKMTSQKQRRKEERIQHAVSGLLSRDRWMSNPAVHRARKSSVCPPVHSLISQLKKLSPRDATWLV